MDKIQELMEAIETKARQTKEEQATTLKRLPEFETEFETLGVEARERMLQAVGSLVSEVWDDSDPRWLSLLGGSGTGKTMLATEAYLWVRKYCRVYDKPVFFQGMQHCTVKADRDIAFVDCRKLASRARSGDFGFIERICAAHFVVLDDVGAPRDTTGFVAELYERVANERLGKWMIVTSNFGLGDIAEKVDVRLASRLLRGGSKVLENSLPDWNLR